MKNAWWLQCTVLLQKKAIKRPALEQSRIHLWVSVNKNNLKKYMWCDAPVLEVRWIIWLRPSRSMKNVFEPIVSHSRLNPRQDLISVIYSMAFMFLGKKWNILYFYNFIVFRRNKERCIATNAQGSESWSAEQQKWKLTNWV